MQDLISKLPIKYQWAIHNVFGHPLSEIAHLLGFEEMSRAIHDKTIPKEKDQKNDN